MRLLLHAGEVPPPPLSAVAEAPVEAEAVVEAAGGALEDTKPLLVAEPEPEAAVEADAAGDALPEGMEAVGFRVAVFWPGDSTWCAILFSLCGLAGLRS